MFGGRTLPANEQLPLYICEDDLFISPRHCHCNQQDKNSRSNQTADRNQLPAAAGFEIFEAREDAKAAAPNSRVISELRTPPGK